MKELLFFHIALRRGLGKRMFLTLLRSSIPLRGILICASVLDVGDVLSEQFQTPQLLQFASKLGRSDWLISWLRSLLENTKLLNLLVLTIVSNCRV